MPRNERSEDAFLSPAVETYAYRYVTLHVQKCRRETKMAWYFESLNEQLVTVVSLRVPRQSRKTLSTSTFKIPRKQNSRTFYLTLLLKRQEAPYPPAACKSWIMTRQNNVLDARQHLGLVKTLVIKEGNRVLANYTVGKAKAPRDMMSMNAIIQNDSIETINAMLPVTV